MRETFGKLFANETAEFFSKELTAVFSGVFLCSASASALFLPLKRKENAKNLAKSVVASQPAALDPSSPQTFKVKYLKEARRCCFAGPSRWHRCVEIPPVAGVRLGKTPI